MVIDIMVLKLTNRERNCRGLLIRSEIFLFIAQRLITKMDGSLWVIIDEIRRRQDKFACSHLLQKVRS